MTFDLFYEHYIDEMGMKDQVYSDFLATKIELDKVTRLEIIDHTKSLEDGGGRTVVFWDDKKQIDISIQDDNKTLKVFIHERSIE